MKRNVLLILLFLGLVVLAVGGWAVQGVRAALAGPRRLHPAPATP